MMIKTCIAFVFAALLHLGCSAQQISVGSIGNQPIDAVFLKNIQTIWPEFTFVHDSFALSTTLLKMYSVNKSIADEASKNLSKTDSIFLQIEQAKQLLEIKLLGEYYLQKEIDAVTVNDNEIRAYYTEHRQQFAQPAEASFFQIMIGDTSKQTLTSISKLVDERKTLTGEALQASGIKQDDYSISYESFVLTPESKKLYDLFSATPIGKFTPVQGEKGIHGYKLYYLLSYRPERIKSFENVKQECSAELLNQKRQQIRDKYYTDAQKKYPVKVTLENLPTKK